MEITKAMDTNKKIDLLTKVKKFPQLSISIAFLVVFVLLSITTDNFLTSKNLINVLRQGSATMIVSIGMTFVLVLGGIDLSVGSVACLSGTIAAGLMVNNNVPAPLAIVAAILVGSIFGIFNGIAIAKINLPPFIVTLATMSVGRGLALIYTGGRPITGIPESALYLGRGYFLGIPIPVYFMFGVIIVGAILISKTKFSRHMFAIGGNEECARLSGIKVNKVKVAIYGLCGTTAAITGILLTMRLASGQPTLGEGLEMDAIASAVLGGTTLSGGKGYILGTVLGGLFLTVLGNGLNLLGISSFVQQIFKGIMILIAVSMYERKKK